MWVSRQKKKHNKKDTRFSIWRWSAASHEIQVLRKAIKLCKILPVEYEREREEANAGTNEGSI